MASFVGPRCMIRCALTLALVVACAPPLAVAAPASPPATAAPGGNGWPGRLSKIPGPMPTTPQDMLMMADALLRGGHEPEARLVLQQVIAQYADTPWVRWAYLGLGFLELARGHFDQARPFYEAAATPGFSQDTALVVMALLDAQAGNTANAAATLDRLAVDASVRQAVRDAAAVGAGYVRYWAGDYEGAAVAFAVLPDNNPGSPLADDALYGLARSFQHLGDPKAAEEVLERINEMEAQGFDDAHVRPALRQLELREIVRATRKRYGDVPWGQPDQMLIALLDVNGRALAKGSLAALAKQQKRAAKGTAIAAAAGDAKDYLRRRSMVHISPEAPMGTAPSGERESHAKVTPADDGNASPTADHASPDASGGGGAGWLLLLLLVAALAVVIRRRTSLPIPKRAASRPARP
jgi:MYXO-CTERM domain-containing protein